MTDSLLEPALAAVARGFYVFPARPGTKIPMVKWGSGDGSGNPEFGPATRDAVQVIKWWTKWPGANIGIATKPSGLVVIDTDTAQGSKPLDEWALPGVEDGEDVLALLAEWNGSTGEYLNTYTVQTASDGFHRYYQAPTGLIVPNSQGRVGWKLDVRGGGPDGIAGGIVFAEGSRRTDGLYRRTLDLPIAPLPMWFARIAVKIEETARAVTAAAPPRAYGAQASGMSSRMSNFVASAPKTEHGKRLFWAANELRDEGMPEGEAIEELFAVSQTWLDCKNPWTRNRVATAVRSAYSRASRKK